MVFSVRKFNPDQDYFNVCEWWKAREWTPAPLDHLPNTGLIVESPTKKFAAAWLFMTTTGFAWLEYVVTNPTAKMKDRYKAVDMLIGEMVKTSDMSGVKTIITSLKTNGLKKMYRKHGFGFEEPNMTNLYRSAQHGSI